MMFNDSLLSLPLAMVLGAFELQNDVELDGDLETEVNRMLSDYVSDNTLTVQVAPEAKTTVHASYKAGTKFLMVFNDLIQRFHLRTDVSVINGKWIQLKLLK